MFHLMLRNCLAFVLLALGACAHRAADPDDVVPLQYDSDLANADFPNPAVRLTFHGQAAWFLLDTGAGVHTLADWFVHAADMKLDDSLAEGVQGIDSTGEAVKFRAVRGFVGQLRSGATLTLDVAAVATFPPMFETAKIGGLINPQLLAGDELAATLDLRVPELRIEPFDDAVRRTKARQIVSREVKVCRAAESPIPNLLFALSTTTHNGEGWLKLDSGAAVTKITSASPLLRGVELEPGGETVGLAGRRHKYSLARRLSMSFAGHPKLVDAAVVQEMEPGCGPDGLLGMDAIARCAFVLGRKSLAIACEAR